MKLEFSNCRAYDPRLDSELIVTVTIDAEHIKSYTYYTATKSLDDSIISFGYINIYLDAESIVTESSDIKQFDLRDVVRLQYNDLAEYRHVVQTLRKLFKVTTLESAATLQWHERT